MLFAILSIILLLGTLIIILFMNSAPAIFEGLGWKKIPLAMAWPFYPLLIAFVAVWIQWVVSKKKK